MLTLTKSHTPENLEWQFLSEKLQASDTLAKLVLTAWQMGWWLAKILVEQQLAERAHQTASLGNCAKCGSRLQSKGFVSRRMLTLVGWVQWRRRIGRCPNRCLGSQYAPFDAQLGIAPYQQTSTELMRLGCLLAVLMPLELATWVLQQVSGIRLSNDTLWQWVQTFGQQSMKQLSEQLQQLANGVEPMLERLDSTALTLPLIIAADGVTVPFRSSPGTASGKIVAARNQSRDSSTAGSASNPLWQNCDSSASASCSGCVGRDLCLTTPIATRSISSRHCSCLPSRLD